MSSIFKAAFSLVSPKFYATTFQNIVKSSRAQFAAGSSGPLFKGMLLVGVTGYVMEYSMVGSEFISLIFALGVRFGIIFPTSIYYFSSFMIHTCFDCDFNKFSYCLDSIFRIPCYGKAKGGRGSHEECAPLGGR